jgi:heme/copper-type cytochrome/quinol oxidase subunit 3
VADDALVLDTPLPVGSKGRLSSGWWGMICVIATEAALFAYLFFSFYYLAAQAHGAWPPDGPPSLRISIPGTILLIAGSLTMAWGEHGIRRGRSGRLLAGIVATLVVGIVFLALQGVEWRARGKNAASDLYDSLYFTITGFHMAHVAVGLVMLAVLGVWTARGYFGERRHSAVSIGVIYWHFVTVVWLFVFFTFYVMPFIAR